MHLNSAVPGAPEGDLWAPGDPPVLAAGALAGLLGLYWAGLSSTFGSSILQA